MAEQSYIIKVEEGMAATDGKPSIGPVYRSRFAENGFPAPIPGMDSCWDIFRFDFELFSLSLFFGAGTVEFIICHTEVSIAFVEEKKIAELFKTFPNSTKYLRTIVSFGKITLNQKAEAEKHGLAIFTWEEFMQLVGYFLSSLPVILQMTDDSELSSDVCFLQGENKQYDLPIKKKNDICTIMYTSGTTGDPKGVLISNESIITLLAGVNSLLERVNEQLTMNDVYISYLPLAHIFDRVIEELFISHGASIGFWRGDVKLLVEDLGELKPSIFCAVPRVLDRIYSVKQLKSQELERWAADNGVTGDFESICKNHKAREYILGELTKTGKEKQLKGFEFIKAVHLDHAPFDMERDLLTPTFKKKRPQLLKYYQIKHDRTGDPRAGCSTVQIYGGSYSALFFSV
ncbi:hypothetical protein GQ457_06G037780 [Hibiscus cannabinus]